MTWYGRAGWGEAMCMACHSTSRQTAMLSRQDEGPRLVQLPLNPETRVMGVSVGETPESDCTPGAVSTERRAQR